MRAFFVTKRLAFGSAINSWRHVEHLRDLGITHVVNLRKSTNNKKIQQFQFLWLPFKDDKRARPRWFYKRALKFFEKTMRQRNSKLFVMCHHGICRSSSLAYFFLRASGTDEPQAETKVWKARPRAIIARAYRDSCEKFLERFK